MSDGGTGTIKEQLEEEKRKLRGMSAGGKLEYIWQYYKLHIAGIAVLLIIIGSIIYGAFNKPPASYAAIAAFGFYTGDEFEPDIEARIAPSIDNYNETGKLYVHSFYGSDDPTVQMAVLQKFAAMIAARELDLIIAWRDNFDDLIFDGLIMPLSEAGISAPEELKVYGSAEDGEPQAYGVSLKNSEVLKDMGINPEQLVIGIVANTTLPDNAVLVLNLIAAPPPG